MRFQCEAALSFYGERLQVGVCAPCANARCFQNYYQLPRCAMSMLVKRNHLYPSPLINQAWRMCEVKSTQIK